MKFLFLSDVHGSVARLRQVLSFFDENGCDVLCLGGDLLNYGPRNGLPDGLDATAVAEALNSYRRRIIAVRGNCDSEVDQMLLNFPMMADYAVISDGPRRFFLTHGHKFIKDHDPLWFNADVVVSGHTHLWRLESLPSGPLFCNTGSITFPKDGNPPTFAFYDGAALSIRTLDGLVLASHVF